MARRDSGDLTGALAGFRSFAADHYDAGAPGERAYVVVALVAIAGILDHQGDARSALAAYEAAFEYADRDAADACGEPWVTDFLAGARTRRQWLARRHRSPVVVWLTALGMYGAAAVAFAVLRRLQKTSLG